MHFVFLHGVNNDAGVWEPVIAALGDGHTADALDLPPLPDVDDIAAWVAERVPEGSVIVGHSFGGVVAKAILVRHPATCRAVVLINPSLRSDTPERAAARIARLAEVDSEAKYLAMATGNLDKVFHPANAGRAEIVAARERSVRVYGLERFQAHSRALAGREDRTVQLRESEVPMLVVAAADDLVVPASAQRAWAEEVGASFIAVEAAGHMLPAEEPSAVAGAIAEWVEGR